MSISFVKMHGLGNDYVFVAGPLPEGVDAAGLARRVSDRHFGVGGDGLIRILPAEAPAGHARMVVYNADGSRAEMCGNGVRCVARYLFDRGGIDVPRRDGYAVFTIETDAGVRKVRVRATPEGEFASASVDMGPPGLRWKDLPLSRSGPWSEADAGEIPDFSRPPVLEIEGARLPWRGVSMGNPHAVIDIESIETADGGPPGKLADLPLERWGPAIEHHPAFPERINVELVHVVARDEIEARVWERGSGETLACGTGACAALVATALSGRAGREATVRLPGGDLRVRWDGEEAGGRVELAGPASEVFRGELDL